jgi:hypothetical protein
MHHTQHSHSLIVSSFACAYAQIHTHARMHIHHTCSQSATHRYLTPQVLGGTPPYGSLQPGVMLCQLVISLLLSTWSDKNAIIATPVHSRTTLVHWPFHLYHRTVFPCFPNRLPPSNFQFSGPASPSRTKLPSLKTHTKYVCCA